LKSFDDKLTTVFKNFAFYVR